MSSPARKFLQPMLFLAIIGVCFANLACSLFQPSPEDAQNYPWLVQPVQAETKAYFCEKLSLPSDHSICRVDHNTLGADLARVLEEKFPVNQTFYSEVAETLKGYPVEVENTRTPDGNITSRRYVYLLTEFDGFCMYFSMTDLQSERVEKIYSSSVGYGSPPTVCGSLKLREQLRPWLK